MSLARAILKDSFIYAVAASLVKAAQLVVVPIYVTRLAPGESSFVDLSLGYSLFAATLLSLGITNGMAREMADASAENKRKFTSTAFCFIIAVSLLLFMLASFIPNGIAIWIAECIKAEPLIHVISSAKRTLLLIVSLTLGGMIVDVIYNHYRWTLRPMLVLTVTLTQSLIVILATLLLVQGSSGLEGALIALVSSTIGAAFIGVILDTKAFFSKPKIQYLIKMLKFSTPLVVGASLSAAALYMGRFLGRDHLTATQADEMMLALKICGILVPILAAIAHAMAAHIYKNYQNPEIPSQLALVYRRFLAFAMIAIAAVTFSAPWLCLVIGSHELSGAAMYVGITSVSTLLAQSYTFFFGLWITRKTWLISTIAIGTALLTILFALLFVPAYGIWGALAATLLAQCIGLSATAISSQRYYFVPFHKPSCSVAVMIAISLCVLPALITVEIGVNLVIQRFICLVTHVTVILFFMLSNNDRITICRMLKKLVSLDGGNSIFR